MNDLIDRQEAIEAMTNTLWHYPNECYRNLNEYEFSKGLAELGLRNVPPAEPEIIRCKDCKNSEHWYRDRRRCYLWSETGVSVFDSGFCNYAERRTDD